MENTQAQYFYNLLRKLYTSVLNNDNRVMHQVCQYKCFVSCYILWAYRGFCQNNELEIDSNLQFERVLFTKTYISLVFFILHCVVGSPPC